MISSKFNAVESLSMDGLSLKDRLPPFEFGKPLKIAYIPPAPKPKSRRTRSRKSGKEVYHIAELRQRIISLLSRSDKVRFMRVGKPGMDDVVKEIYGKMKGADVLLVLASTSPRRRIYCSAINIIDAHYMPLTKPDNIRFGFTHSPEIKSKKYPLPILIIHKSTPIIFTTLISEFFRIHCPNLHQILFGSRPPTGPGARTWSVNYDITRRASYADMTKGRIVHEGIIFKLDNRSIPLYKSTSHSWLQTRLRPPNGYNIHVRFNLSFRGPISPEIVDFWSEIIRTHPGLVNIYKNLELDDLPIQLRDLSMLYLLQIKAGYTERIQHIYANRTQSFTLYDFESFAKIASESLTTLILARSWKAVEYQNNLDFTYLSSLKGIIRTHLPNLQTLSIALAGVETAERDCLNVLAPTILNQHGTIKDFTIYISQPPLTKLFSVIRVLYGACANGASIKIMYDKALVGINDLSGPWQLYCSVMFLSYLQNLSEDRKHRIATSDFSTLNADLPKDLSELRYYPDGRPMVCYSTAWMTEEKRRNGSGKGVIGRLRRKRSTSVRLSTGMGLDKSKRRITRSISAGQMVKGDTKGNMGIKTMI